MSKKIAYRCEACGKIVEIVDGEMTMPECCERSMVKDDSLDFCEKPPGDPEYARLFDNNDPCDDGRTGKI